MDSVYQFAIQNVKNYIRSAENTEAITTGQQMQAFEAARVLGVAFIKEPMDVFVDLIRK